MTEEEESAVTPEQKAARRDAIMRRLRDSADDIARRTQGQQLHRPLEEIKQQREQVDLDDAKAILKMKKLLARASFIAVGAQLLVADTVFVIYAFMVDWQIPSEVMIGWLSATVIQVVGVVHVIARHLFPVRDSKGTRASSAV